MGLAITNFQFPSCKFLILNFIFSWPFEFEIYNVLSRGQRYLYVQTEFSLYLSSVCDNFIHHKFWLFHFYNLQRTSCRSYHMKCSFIRGMSFVWFFFRLLFFDWKLFDMFRKLTLRVYCIQKNLFFLTNFFIEISLVNFHFFKSQKSKKSKCPL